MNISTHILLAFFWIIYFSLHSLLAAPSVKDRIKNRTGVYYKYYRISYSLFAAFSLVLILLYLYNMPGIMLWAAGTIQKIIACIFLVAGFAIMLICTKKYFADLSGIDVFVKNKTPNTLQVSGLNKYVRHPLYAGTLLFVWSLFFINPLLSYLISAILITIYTRIGIYFEEKKLLIEFGDAYKKFSVSTPMLIPHLF